MIATALPPKINIKSLAEQFGQVRAHSETICHHLETEDYVVQPVADVSPPKWHLGHTTWFWETFVLQPHAPDYRIFHDDFSFVFNSYYETVGRRVLRTDRGNLSRPTVADVYRYRQYVDEAMRRFLIQAEPTPELTALLELGFNHEQQHQELLIADIKYILGHNPLLPAIAMPLTEYRPEPEKSAVSIREGIYEIGFREDENTESQFHFDNEDVAHKVYLNDVTLAGNLITNAGYQQFMDAGGYRDFRFWLADGWAWVNATNAKGPLYWHNIDGQWHYYSFDGLVPVDPDAPVCHVCQYEADAFARWAGTRLPTEFEWETAAKSVQTAGPLSWGRRWEWTNSAYLPYPGFVTVEGAVGEYNGKFMSNQLVLRGGSVATPEGHSRATYRNFFQPDKQWQFTGIRVVK